MGRNFILTLGLGMFCGFFSFYLLNSTINLHTHTYHIDEGISPPRSAEKHAHNHEELEESAGPADEVVMHSHHEAHHAGEGVESQRLEKEVRVLCWIMTNPKNHEKKAKHVKATWARRCNKILFISSEKDEKLGSIGLEVGEGRDHLWQKTKAAFSYVYNNHYNDADWFIKADDDTYVIVENLRYMLSPYDASKPIWFGCKFKKYVKQGYMSGGAGYVLSREALRRFVEEALPNPKKCRQDSGGAEDVEIGKCMQNVGVVAGDSRDSLGRGRFFPFVPEHHLVPGHIGPKNWYWEWIYYPSKVGLDCCSDTAVSFHYVPPNKMYELEYFLYHLRPYGIQHSDPFPPPLAPDRNSIPQEVLDKYKKIEEKEKDEQISKDSEIHNDPKPAEDSIFLSKLISEKTPKSTDNKDKSPLQTS